jgi:hypothetical protein
MGRTIDVGDLPPDKIRMVEEFAEFLKMREKERKGKKEHVTFSKWPLGVKGRLGREEIYEYL